MHTFYENFQALNTRLREAETLYARVPQAVGLLAVSKFQSAQAVRALAALGQRDFGENYLQEGLEKITALRDLQLTWHFIGALQSNKTAGVAAHFDWVHTLDRAKIAERLNDQRPHALPPLNVCVQVNISNEDSKSGVAVHELHPLLECASRLPRLRLRGLMALPAPETDFSHQRAAFREVHELYQRFRTHFALDTLSIGTTADMDAAIAEGATIVRIGTALFGARPPADTR